jgi:hypothetical protein
VTFEWTFGFCSDETVEVGANLYELDTNGTATFEKLSNDGGSAIEPPLSVEMPVTASPPSSAAASTSINGEATTHRLPSIKFLGKQGWEAARKGHAEVTAAPSASSSVAKKPNAVTTIFDNTILHPMYGRPRFSEAEMEALLTGGATVAPTVVLHSSGAKFK